MTSPRGRLTNLQEQVLDAFFADTSGFYLTGGGALAGFYLKHRETRDLDLFTHDGVAFQARVLALPAWAQEHGFILTTQMEAPAFHRTLVSDGTDAVVVDLVHDASPQLGLDPVVVEHIPLDPLSQIFVNKITALVGRQEERDIVDVVFLERQGFRLEDQIESALAKDGGCTPATLAWLLEPWAAQLPDDKVFAGALSGAELKEHMRALAARMRRLAFPRAP